MKRFLIAICCLLVGVLAASAQCPSSQKRPTEVKADVHYYGLFKQYHIKDPVQPQAAPQQMQQQTDPAVLAALEALKAQNAEILRQLQAQQTGQQIRDSLRGQTAPPVAYVPPTPGAPVYVPPTPGAPVYTPPTPGAPVYNPMPVGPPVYVPAPPTGKPIYTPPAPPMPRMTGGPVRFTVAIARPVK